MDAGCAAVYHYHRLNARIDLYESMLQRPVIKTNREKLNFRTDAPHSSKMAQDKKGTARSGSYTSLALAR